MIGATDRARFVEQGYLVVEGVVPDALCARVRSVIADFTGVDDDDPSTWQRQGAHGHGIVPVHHAQALWDVRQLPAMHALFAALYETERLWVSVDRVSVKVPARTFETAYNVDHVHWDGDPRRAGGRSIQGLVYLADTAPEQGAFCCVPGLFRDLDGWLPEHQDDPNPLRPDVTGYEVLPVGAPAGSLVLWDRRMPHSSGENLCDRPRWVQYVAMHPAGDDTARAALARLWREKRPPDWALRQNVPGQQNPEPGEPATLTPLGRRLAGVDPW
jgi:ectoine hydroxylase-related dioxygenase (phytanoyl-CoA dioxygenase family)